MLIALIPTFLDVHFNRLCGFSVRYPELLSDDVENEKEEGRDGEHPECGRPSVLLHERSTEQRPKACS